ncbi:MAG: PASTA domain-containing protein, partial [Streptosporangiaceae bacterium]
LPVAGPAGQPGADGAPANGAGSAAYPVATALADGSAGMVGPSNGAGQVGLPSAYGGDGGPYPASGMPPGNRTMVVPVGEEPEYADSYRRGRRYRADRSYREPRLQRWLFSHRILIVLAIVVAMLVAGGLAWWLDAGQYTTVPSVTGMAVSTASGDLTNAGLHAVTGPGRNSYSMPAGQVISTNPAIGGRVSRGGTVVIVPSLGPVLVTMPSVTGEPLAQAQQTVQAAGLKLAQPSSQTSASIPAGVVISTNPVAYQHWPKNKPVELVVSSGQPLPNLVGQQISTAQAVAATGGFSINPVADNSSAQPAGTVTGQSPGPGTPITSGEVVTLQVSTGSQNGQGEVAIPDVRGMSASQAANVLQAAGFNVQISHGLFGQKVTSYTPTGQAPPGTTITITVGYL